MGADLSKYLGLFVSEATEHLESLAADLVKLEKEPSRDAIDSTFRHAHSVKGMAASMGFARTAALAHHLEDLVQLIRQDASRLTGDLVDLMLSATDALLSQVRSAAEGQAIEGDAALEAALAARVSSASPAEDKSPSPSRPAATAPSGAEPSRTRPATLPARAGGTSARFAIGIRIAPSCPQPAARAFVALKRLSKLGNIVELKPPMEELRAGRIPEGAILFELETGLDESAVRTALTHVTEMEMVSLAALEKAAPAPKRAPAPAPPALNGSGSPSTVRIKTELLDYFLDTVGELILATSQIREIGKALPLPARPQLDEGVDRLHGLVKDLHDKVMSARMTPLSTVTDRLPRTVRDIARRREREVELVVTGAEVELDRTILENLSEPILHLLRNCIDHGIESAAERAAAGKTGSGRVSINVRRERDRVALEIEDNGRGMDAQRLKQSAVTKGLLSEDAAARLSDKEALALCFLPGVSTARDVSDISGRGVGMDAVKRSLEEVGGAMEIHSERGVGTRFTLHLPLTVSVVNLMLVGVGREIVGFPVTKVLSALELDSREISKNGDGSLLPHSQGLLPVHLLSELLGFPATEARGSRPYIVVEGDRGKVALAVDRLLGQEEAVLKTLTRPLDLVPGVSGVTILGTGRPVFILDVPGLLAS